MGNVQKIDSMKSTKFESSTIGRIDLPFREIANTIFRSDWEDTSNAQSLCVKY